MFYTRILVLGGKYFIRINKTVHYVLSRYFKKKELCVHLMLLLVHRAYSCALNTVEGQEIFLKMSKFLD
jgi:hypothetical protein